MLSHATGHMSVMVLHCDSGYAFKRERVLGRCILRMQVVRNDGRFSAEQAFEVSDGVLKRFERLVVFKIADVLAHESVAFFCQTERVFQVSAAGENGILEGYVQRDRSRRVAARPRHEQFLAVNRSHYRVVTAHVKRSVMDKKVSRYLAEPL